MSTFNLEIITPHKIVVKQEVAKIIARTTEGDMGVLAGHAPLVAELAIGEMKIEKDDKNIDYYFISGGFLEISKQKVLILADKAMRADEIDIEEAAREKEIYEARLAKLGEDREIAITQRALQESLTKIRVGERLR